MEHLKYIIPNMEYEEQAKEYIDEHHRYNSQINGSGGLNRYIDNYPAWLTKIEQERHPEPNEARVPTDTYYLVREEDNHIVGMVNIRHYLNKKLSECGGHIGYGIRPSERQKGYNKINLYLALLRCQELGLKEVYLDCECNNPGSYKTMEALGGIRIKEYSSENYSNKIYRYIIYVDAAIENYRHEYEPKILKRM